MQAYIYDAKIKSVAANWMVVTKPVPVKLNRFGMEITVSLSAEASQGSKLIAISAINLRHSEPIYALHFMYVSAVAVNLSSLVQEWRGRAVTGDLVSLHKPQYLREYPGISCFQLVLGSGVLRPQPQHTTQELTRN